MFHEVRFPTDISFGAAGGPERKVEIVTLANGREERNALWRHSRRRWDAGLGMRSADDLATVIAFFEARGGQLYGFRWKDWTDYKSCQPSGTVSATDQAIGTGDGSRTRFALRKAYRSGDVTYWRPIAKPVAESVRVAINGEPLERGDFTLDERGAVVLPSPPLPGSAVSAGFEFDVPVRFDMARLDVTMAHVEAGAVPDVPVVELRL